MSPSRTILTALLLAMASPNTSAQTLNLGSAGGPDLGEKSAFIGRSAYYQREADIFFARAGDWQENNATVPESDRALGDLSMGYAHWLCARMLTGESARNAAADHRMVVGRLLSEAIDTLNESVEGFVDAGARIGAGEADDDTMRRYARERAALRAFVMRARESFGTPDTPQPMGFTIRSLDNALRPAIGELVPLLSDAYRSKLALVWSGTTTDGDAPTQLVRATRSAVHAPEAKRLIALARKARLATQSVRAIDSVLHDQASAQTESAIERLTSSDRETTERFLKRTVAMGELLGTVAGLRAQAEGPARDQLDAFAQDVVRAVLADPPRGSLGGSPTNDDRFVNAFGVCARALRIAGDRRTLAEPARMTGNTRRAWLLMHAEQGDREAALLEALRDLVANPSRVTSPAIVSSIARTRTGYERLLAIRMCDDWLDELRDGGRLSVLLGPTVSQRSRDLMIFTLRDRIRDAADRDVRERAIDDLNLLRERAELFGRTPLEDELASGGPEWLDETIGERLALALAEARGAWVQAWVDDDDAQRTRWADRLEILTRGRDAVALAQQLESDEVLRRCLAVPACALPDDAVTPLRDRVRGIANGAVRASLSDDPATADDDRAVRARLTASEDAGSSARAFLALSRLAHDEAPTLEDPLLRLVAAAGVLHPRDDPARVHRHDIASYVRWLHELRFARNAPHREAILAHLDEVGADVSARLSGD